MGYTSVAGVEGYRFPGDMVDVRGFEVKSALDGGAIGRVGDVLIDEGGAPRFLGVRLEDSKSVLLPLGEARIDAAEGLVWVDGLTVDQFGRIPEYAGDPRKVGGEYERRVERTYREARLSSAVGSGSGRTGTSPVERFAARRDRSEPAARVDPAEAEGDGREIHIELDGDRIAIEEERRGDARVEEA